MIRQRAQNRDLSLGKSHEDRKRMLKHLAKQRVAERKLRVLKEDFITEDHTLRLDANARHSVLGKIKHKLDDLKKQKKAKADTVFAQCIANKPSSDISNKDKEVAMIEKKFKMSREQA